VCGLKASSCVEAGLSIFSTIADLPASSELYSLDAAE
jgi:hypothetical protein